MKLRTKHNGYFEVDSLQEVMAILTQLGWTEEEDGFLVCDNGSRGFVQVAKWRPGQYIVEWCAGDDPTCPRHGLRRAQYQDSANEIIDFGHQEMGQFNLYQNDLLTLRDMLDVLTAFWCGRSWLSRVCWRDQAPEMRKFIQLNDDRHARMSLRG